MPTDADIQQLILTEVGDTTPSVLAPMIVSIWDSYADKAATFPRLQELYTKKRCIDIRLAAISNQVDFAMDGALSLRLSQRSAYLEKRRNETQLEIVRLETISRANRPPVTGPLGSTLVNIEDADLFRGAPVDRDVLTNPPPSTTTFLQ